MRNTNPNSLKKHITLTSVQRNSPFVQTCGTNQDAKNENASVGNRDVFSIRVKEVTLNILIDGTENALHKSIVRFLLVHAFFNHFVDFERAVQI